MAKITAEMREITDEAKPFVLATATKEGKPNAVPIGLAKVISDDEILLMDVAMLKTRQNIDANPLQGATGGICEKDGAGHIELTCLVEQHRCVGIARTYAVDPYVLFSVVEGHSPCEIHHGSF